MRRRVNGELNILTGNKYAPPASVDYTAGTQSYRAAAEPAGSHPGFRCARSGQEPIVGTRYKDVRPDRDFDLCEAEYEKLGEEEKRHFIAIHWPDDDSDIEYG